jgi:fumarate reductase flavoprotein subunit
MAREIGAQLVGMSNFYGHLLCQDALRDDRLWPYPIIDFIAAGGLVIDGSGRRFMDEGRGGVYMANCVARLRDPLSATAIFDETIWNGPARDFILPANPNLVSAGGTILEAANLSDLARKIGLPESALGASVSLYNAAVDTGATATLDPPRTTSTYRAYPIRHAPFRAVRLCAGVTYTMGGIAIDGAARVLDERNKPIQGLYAAGCATGGLEGGEFAGYVGGLAKSAVTALRAANAIAGNRAP